MLEVAVVLALIGLNGLFVLSELAVVSARKPRLKTMAEAGRRGAGAALALAEEPGRFLSTVQIGITLVGILTGAFSGAGLSQSFDEVLEGWGVPTRVAEPLAYALVIAAITYLSVIVGELVPKHVALKDPEGIACAVAPLMRAISRAAGPVVWGLDASTRLILRAFGARAESASAVTDEEIRTVMAEAETAGVIEGAEREMITGVMRLADRSVRGLMTPRTDVDWIDLARDEARVRERLLSTRRARLPVCEGGPDRMIGVVSVRDLLPGFIGEESIPAGDLRARVRALVKVAPIVPDTMDALAALGVLRGAEVPMALVHDEYGHFDGVVTPGDVLDAIAGAFRADEDEDADPEAVRREDGSWLLAGWMPADEMADRLGIALPERREYETVAGLVIAQARHLPRTGEAVEALGWRFEVVDLDGRRVDKVLATRVNTPP